MDFIEALPEVTLEKARELILVNLEKQKRNGGLPVFLIGTPGRGKSTLMKKISEELNWNFFDVNLGAVDEAFFVGLPFVDKEGRTFWSKPPFVSELEKLAERGNVLVFLDDFHLVSGEIQKALMELLTSRRLSGHSIPDNVYFVVAGNFSPEAGTQVIFTPIFNRIKPVRLSNEKNQVLEEFLSFIEKEGLIDKMSTVGLTFVESHPDVLVEREKAGVFGSLRSVTDLLIELKIAEERFSKKVLEEHAKALIYSSVNENADQFYNFYSVAIGFKDISINNPKEVVNFLVTKDENTLPVYNQIAIFVVKRIVREWKKSLFSGKNLEESWKILWDFVNELKRVLKEEHIAKLSAVKKAVYLLYPNIRGVIEEFSEYILSGDEKAFERLEEVKRVYEKLFGEKSDKPLSSFFLKIASIEVPFVIGNNKVEMKSLENILQAESFKEKMALW